AAWTDSGSQKVFASRWDGHVWSAPSVVGTAPAGGAVRVLEAGGISGAVLWSSFALPELPPLEEKLHVALLGPTGWTELPVLSSWRASIMASGPDVKLAVAYADAPP